MGLLPPLELDLDSHEAAATMGIKLPLRPGAAG